jgi:hypothetical protein
LYTSLSNCRQIIEETSSLLTLNQTKDSDSTSTFSSKIYSLDDMSILSETQTATFKPLIQFDLPLSTNDDAAAQQERKLVIFNSNLQANRREIVSIRVNTPHIEIYDDTKNTLIDNVQVSLVWPNMDGGALSVDTSNSARMSSASKLTHGLDFDTNTFECLFEVNVKGLSFSKYTIRTNPSKTMIRISNLTRVDFYQREVNAEYLENVNNEIGKK